MEKLVKIQNELKVPKGNYNSFGKYKYRSCEDILEAVKPILLKHEAQLLITDRVSQIGNKLFLQATATLYFKGEQIKGLPIIYESQGFAELSEHKGMSAEQATGTASSYARKYALNGLFLIDETEADADNDNVKAPVKKTLTEQVEDAKAKLITAKDLNDLKAKWSTLTKVEQAFQEVIELKDKLKATLK